MLSKINSAGLSGMEAFTVTVEADESGGLPRISIVGNVSPSVREASERCSVGLKNTGISLPPKRITINLSPAGRKKDGTGYDLAIAAGIYISVFTKSCPYINSYGFIGEVGLDGEIKHIRGVLPLVSSLKDSGLKGAVVPLIDMQEALNVRGMDIVPIGNLKDLFTLLESEENFLSFKRPEEKETDETEYYDLDFSEVKGQKMLVRSSLIAASGRHNLLISGIAGSGKSMIAKRIPGILPPLTREENIEITKIYSIAGLLPGGKALMNKRPFRSPHHTITPQALLGGSSRDGLSPGELALSTKGVLFLDELPLFSKQAVESLRQPLEDRKAVIDRINGHLSYNIDMMLVAAMNPCPCGYFPDRSRCRCTEAQIRSYQKGISRPILERIDILAEASPVEFQEVLDTSNEESSSSLREKVIKARLIQKERFRSSNIKYNADMGIKEIKKFCPLGKKESLFMEDVYKKMGLSLRSYHKILRVSRTIADLEGKKDISTRHLSEACQYRGLEEKLFQGNIGF